jgi:hypothetical protein
MAISTLLSSGNEIVIFVANSLINTLIMLSRKLTHKYNLRNASSFLLMVLSILFTFQGKDLDNCKLLRSQRMSWRGLTE